MKLRNAHVLCLVFLLAWGKGFAQLLEKEYINPASGYTQVVAVTHGNVKTIYVSGQVAEGDDLATQIEGAFKALEAQLAAAGATFQDIVKMNTYIVNYQPKDLAVFRGIRERLYGNERMPTSTLVGVQALALPEWLVEMDAVAIIEVK